jgi:energy-coupling factor transporter transmembrane protein EcfT
MGAVAFIVRDLLFMFLLLAGTFVTALPLKDRLSRYGKGTRGLLAMFALIAILQALLVPGRSLLVLHPLGHRFGLFTLDGLIVGTWVMARLGILVFTSLIFTASVTERELTDALLSLKVPFPVVLSVNLVLRALPRLMEDAMSIRDAYRMRRLGRGSGYMARWKDLGRGIVPLFVTSMVSAHRTGVSLELRGYVSKSFWKPHVMRMGLVDIAVACLMLLVLAAAVVSASTGMGPSVLL